MSARDPVPVLVGIGTATQREEDPARAAEPLGLMIAATRAAGADCGRPDLLASLDRILVPKGRWHYADPGRAIARAVRAERSKSVLSTVGVLQQSLIGEACRRIRDGEIESALVVGGDAGYRILRARIADVQASESEATGEPDAVLAPKEELRHPAEIRAGLRMPVGLYAILDSAFRAARGRSTEQHRHRLADLYARFTAIAAENRHAWTRRELQPDEIRLPSDRNPMQAFPYAKRHCSSWNVDQAGALLFCSEAKALALGIDPARFVYPSASTESNHMVPVVARADLDSCRGAGIAGRAALEGAGIAVSDLDLVELYSCFPVAVEAYAEELGIGAGRDLTVTGGMPFAGGPYNNYVIQATARMGELLRSGRGGIGLVGSVSGVLTKQGFGLWSRSRPGRPFHFADLSDEVAGATRPREVAEDYSGPARIVGYTVVHEKGQARGIVIADDPAGRRVLATSEDPDVVALMERTEMVGRMAEIEGDRFSLADADAATRGPAP